MKYLEKRKQKKASMKLFSILNDCMSYFNEVDDNENLAAKEKLIEFYNELKAYKPSTYYELGYTTSIKETHTSYIFLLLNIKEALDKKLYLRACNEIGNLLNFEPTFQKRIYYNLVDLLESYLNIHSHSV